MKGLQRYHKRIAKGMTKEITKGEHEEITNGSRKGSQRDYETNPEWVMKGFTKKIMLRSTEGNTKGSSVIVHGTCS